VKLTYLLPLLLVLVTPTAYAEIIETKGSNYDVTENTITGEAIWSSHAERIMMNGEWQNYVLTVNDQKVIFNSNSIGSLVFDKDSCSYSLYENGFTGNQVIPSVSALASYNNNGTWQNLSVNDEVCAVDVTQTDSGIIILSTKILNEDITTTFPINGTSIVNTIQQEVFHQEIVLDIIKGIKETFKVIKFDGDQNLGITQTLHTDSTIEIGNNVIDIESLSGSSFDKQYIIDNEAEILKIASDLYYNFDIGISELSSVNILYENNQYKINLDYSNTVPDQRAGIGTNYLMIDPTITDTGSSSGSNWVFDLSTLPTAIVIDSGTIDGVALSSAQSAGALASAGGTFTTAQVGVSKKIHTFTSVGSDNFNVASGGSGTVQYMVIGAGGGGTGDGAGGAGGYRTGTHSVSGSGGGGTNYSVIVGDGGAPASYATIAGSGQSSTFASYSATGGGGGGSMGNTSPTPGLAGGSGGGGAGEVNRSPQTSAGGSGVSGQGYDGGDGCAYSPAGAGGGGGGMGGIGEDGCVDTGDSGGDGGIGIANPIVGSTVGQLSGGSYYVGGGGGGGTWQASNQGNGGLGGGGSGMNRAAGYYSGDGSGVPDGLDGSGGGGGGKWDAGTAGTGGTGSVIVTYTDDGSITSTSGTVTTVTIATASPVISITYHLQTVPSTISDLSASLSHPNVNLSFTTPSDGGNAITSFKVYRDVGSGYSLLATASGSSLTSYQDTSPSSGVTNYYKVNAVNGIGEALNSNVGSVFAGVPPDPPTSISATIANTATAPLDVTVTWSSPTQVGTGTLSNFQIFRDGVSQGTVGLVTTFANTVPSSGSYAYTVKAISDHGTSVASSADSITTPSAPSQPTLATVTVLSDTSHKLDWSASNENGSTLQGYKIEYSLDNSAWSNFVSNTGNVAVTRTATSLNVDDQYYWKVSGINGVGTGTASATQNAWTLLSAPTNLVATAMAVDQIDLAWTGISGISSYTIQYESPTGNGFTTLATGVSSSATTYTSGSLTTGTQYNYRIVGVSTNSGSNSVASNEDSANTFGILPAPVLDLLTSVTVNPATVQLDYTASSGSPVATGYKIERNLGSGWVVIKSDTASVATTYLDIATTTLNEPSYRISSINSYGTSVASNELTLTTTATGGGGGGSTKQVSTVVDSFLNLSILGNTHIMTNNEFITGKIPISWDSGENLRISDVNYDDSILDSIKFTIEDTSPIILQGSGNSFSSDDIKYTITTPSQICNALSSDPSKRITTNCLQEKLYELPITVTATSQGDNISQTTLITIDTRSGFGGDTLALFSIFVMVIIAGVGIIKFARKSGNGHRNHSNNGRKKVTNTSRKPRKSIK